MNGRIFQRRLAALFACIVFSMLAPALYAKTFVVNSTADSVDLNPGNGLCLDARGKCTLRAAIMEADAYPGADQIDLSKIANPSKPITLSIPGADESYAATGGDPPWAVTGTPDPSRGDLDVTESLTIVGAGPDKTVIEWPAGVKSASATGDRVFHIQKGTADVAVEISGLTVRNGVTPSPTSLSTTSDGKIWTFKRKGAGIATGPGSYIELVDPNKQHGMCSAEGHGGGHGGGEDEDCGGETGLTVTLTDVRLLDNQSGSDGGGLYNTAQLVLADSVISGNSAKSKGGGLYNGADLTMSDTVVGAVPPEFPNPNTAANGGGMFDGAFHESHIRDSAFVGNVGKNGGGIAGRRRVLMYLTNVTISGNTASEAGGGISTNGQVVMQNDTIADNLAIQPEEGRVGAGINVFAMGAYTYANTLFSNNRLQDASGPSAACGTSGEAVSSSTVLVSVGHNLSDDSTCFLDTALGDRPDTNAMLGPLADNGGPTPTRAPGNGSPAVDTGDNSQCPNNDQRGGLRPADGTLSGNFVCDIGAFEVFIHTADVHIEDVTAPDREYVGDTFPLEISVHNDPAASTAATGVVISTGPLPAGYALSSIVLQPASSASACTVTAAGVSCPIGDLGIGESASVILNGTLQGAEEVQVTAHVASATPVDPLPSNNDGQVRIVGIGYSDLVIHTAVLVAPINKGSYTTLPFTVRNDGPDAASHLRLLITLSSNVTYLGTSLEQGCVFSTEDGGLLCDLGDLATGSTVSGTVTVQPEATGEAFVDFAVDADQLDPAQPDTADVPFTVVKLASSSGGSSGGGSTGTSGSGGGCAVDPSAPFDPTLPLILLLGLLGLRRPARGRS